MYLGVCRSGKEYVEAPLNQYRVPPALRGWSLSAGGFMELRKWAIWRDLRKSKRNGPVGSDSSVIDLQHPPELKCNAWCRPASLKPRKTASYKPGANWGSLSMGRSREPWEVRNACVMRRTHSGSVADQGMAFDVCVEGWIAPWDSTQGGHTLCVF